MGPMDPCRAIAWLGVGPDPSQTSPAGEREGDADGTSCMKCSAFAGDTVGTGLQIAAHAPAAGANEGSTGDSIFFTRNGQLVSRSECILRPGVPWFPVMELSKEHTGYTSNFVGYEGGGPPFKWPDALYTPVKLATLQAHHLVDISEGSTGSADDATPLALKDPPVPGSVSAEAEVAALEDIVKTLKGLVDVPQLELKEKFSRFTVKAVEAMTERCRGIQRRVVDIITADQFSLAEGGSSSLSPASTSGTHKGETSSAAAGANTEMGNDEKKSVAGAQRAA
ncbi:unnamed protein product, partial [Chrysoparadoxa australica]